MIDGNGNTNSVACPTTTQCTAVDSSGSEVTFNPTAPVAIQQAADPAIDAASLEQRAQLSFAEGNGMHAEDLLQEAERIRTQSRRPRSALAAKDAATVTVGQRAG